MKANQVELINIVRLKTFVGNNDRIASARQILVCGKGSVGWKIFHQLQKRRIQIISLIFSNDIMIYIN